MPNAFHSISLSCFCAGEALACKWCRVQCYVVRHFISWEPQTVPGLQESCLLVLHPMHLFSSTGILPHFRTLSIHHPWLWSLLFYRAFGTCCSMSDHPWLVSAWEELYILLLRLVKTCFSNYFFLVKTVDLFINGAGMSVKICSLWGSSCTLYSCI